MAGVNTIIREWVNSRAKPDESRGHFQCPVCMDTWQISEASRHTVECWVPLLLADIPAHADVSKVGEGGDIKPITDGKKVKAKGKARAKATL